MHSFDIKKCIGEKRFFLFIDCKRNREEKVNKTHDKRVVEVYISVEEWMNEEAGIQICNPKNQLKILKKKMKQKP